MTGALFAIGPCYLCGRLFPFDPELVCVYLRDGQREPLCLDCVTRANVIRAERGLPLHQVKDGAYEGS